MVEWRDDDPDAVVEHDLDAVEDMLLDGTRGSQPRPGRSVGDLIDQLVDGSRPERCCRGGATEQALPGELHSRLPVD